MHGGASARLSEHELCIFFDQMFPLGCAGSDVLAEIAPSWWEHDEITELLGVCLWDIFSDNHDVITADGRLVDLGSFRGSAAFLDAHLNNYRDTWPTGDHLRFYLGSECVRGGADLTPVYMLIFRRLKALGADWVYHFPQLFLAEVGGTGGGSEQQQPYSVSEAAAAELEAQKKRREIERLRAGLAASNARACDEAMDRPPPPTVRAYCSVYGRDPRGWPPACPLSV